MEFKNVSFYCRCVREREKQINKKKKIQKHMLEITNNENKNGNAYTTFIPSRSTWR